MNDKNQSENDEYSETRNGSEQESYHSILASDSIGGKQEPGISATEIDWEALADVLQLDVTRSEAQISRSSAASVEVPIPPTPGICRICFQPDSTDSNRCITPCHCRGSMSKVHKGCLEKWLAQSNSTVCEICTFKYKILKIKKYTLLGSMKAWWYRSEIREDPNEIAFDVLLLMVVLPSMATVSYLGYLVTDRILNPDQVLQVYHSNPIYQILSIGIFTALMSFNFILVSYAACRVLYYVSSWFTFYQNSLEVIVIDDVECPTKTL